VDKEVGKEVGYKLYIRRPEFYVALILLCRRTVTQSFYPFHNLCDLNRI